MNDRQTNQGFTLLELLFVIVIATIISTIVIVSLSRLNSSQALEKSSELVASTLNEARSLTLSSKRDTQYGVYFEPSQIVLFTGDTYLSSDPDNVVTIINTLTGIQNITLLGGGTSIVFNRLTGNTDEPGTLEVFLQSSPGTFRTITISSTGVVGLE